MLDSIKKGYNDVVEVYERQHPIVKGAIWVGAGVAIARTVANVDEVSPALGGVINLLALPFELVISAAGDVVSYVIPTFEKMTDPLIPDWDKDGKKEGVGGELRGLIA